MSNGRERLRLAALKYYDHGHSPSQVYNKFKVKQSTLHQWLQQRENEGHVHTVRSSGRPRKLSRSLWNKVYRRLVKQGWSTRRVSTVMTREGVPISHVTIVNEARRHGLLARKGIKKH